jgi:hypothetical protein
MFVGRCSPLRLRFSLTAFAGALALRAVAEGIASFGTAVLLLKFGEFAFIEAFPHQLHQGLILPIRFVDALLELLELLLHCPLFLIERFGIVPEVLRALVALLDVAIGLVVAFPRVVRLSKPFAIPAIELLFASLASRAGRPLLRAIGVLLAIFGFLLFLVQFILCELRSNLVVVDLDIKKSIDEARALHVANVLILTFVKSPLMKSIGQTVKNRFADLHCVQCVIAHLPVGIFEFIRDVRWWLHVFEEVRQDLDSVNVISH